MAILSVIIAPDPRLMVKSDPVERVDAALRKLMDDMLETMYDAPGVGLSAIQVGVPKRVIVVDATRADEERAPHRLVNPELLWTSAETVVYDEGCLSFPDQYAEVERPAAITVGYRDEHDTVRKLGADGLLARCIQHEMDHLEGVLFIEYLSAIRRNIILRKLSKVRKEKERKSA